MDIEEETKAICFCLTNYARLYRKEKRPVIEKIPTKIRDAVLTDSINYICMKRIGIAFGLNQAYLEEETFDDEKVDKGLLVNAMVGILENYLVREKISDSVLEHNDLNNCKIPFEEELGEKVVLDFMSFVAEKNKRNINRDLRRIKNRIITEKYHNKQKGITYINMFSKGISIDEVVIKELEVIAIAYIDYLRTQNLLTDDIDDEIILEITDQIQNHLIKTIVLNMLNDLKEEKQKKILLKNNNGQKH